MPYIQKESVLEKVGIPEHNSDLNAAFWRKALSDYAYDPTINSHSIIFDFNDVSLVGMTPPGLQQISIVEAPKEGGRKSADVALIHLFPNRSLFLFAGDGVRFMEEPPVKLLSILEKYDCKARPDGLLPALLKSEVFGNNLFESITKRMLRLSDKSIPRLFFEVFEYTMKDFYSREQINTLGFRKSQLPAISGTAICIDDDAIIAASIGDPITSYEDPTGYSQPMLPRENMGIDQLTRHFVNTMLAQGKASSVTEALESELFKKWVVYTFNEKMNTVVRVVNGKNFNSTQIVETRLPIAWVNKLRIGSDGLTLGLESEAEESILEFSRMSGNINDLMTYAKRRLANQRKGYSEEVCLQDRTSDDFVGISVEFNNIFSTHSLLEGFYRS